MTVARHVLLVTEPGVDGTFRHVESLADHLMAQSWLVDLACSSRRGSEDLQALIARITARCGAAIDLRVGNHPGFHDLPALLRLHRFVRLRRPAIVHAHSSKAGALTRLLPLPGRPQVFYTPHAYFGLRPGSHWPGRFYNRLEHLLGRRGYTINVSESEAGFAEVLLQIPRERRCTIHNGVDLERFRPSTPAERRAARRELDLPEDRLIVGSLARLSSQKDPHTLYRAFAAALERAPTLHLLHLGTGPNPDYAQELLTPALRRHVTRIPFLSDTLPFYRAIDGLIMTSHYEGLSLVVLEAMACGLPLLLTNVGGNDDVAQLGPSESYLFPAGDVAAAAEGLVRWARPENRSPSNNHRALAMAHFDARQCHARIEEAYREALWYPQESRLGSTAVPT
jgi:glycosyltransferase involved in cell wall biosynthesis